jgi:Phage phiEco32-like COOH.NH2 ligase-type 2
VIQRYSRLAYGTDPEAFLSRGGQIIGSEKVIPAKGERGALPGVVRDGVQVEFNPSAVYGADAKALGVNFQTVLGNLVAHLEHNHRDVSIDWSGLVEVSRAELESLCPENQILGCQPSENVYGVKPILAGEYYPKRSAGGHLHFGSLPKTLWVGTSETDLRANIIPLLDIFVGNTCVMLDRDPGQVERRMNYGRAGEFRRQPHGVEYRTLSSFWTRAYPLLDFVFGMANLVVSISVMTSEGRRIEDGLSKIVDIDNFILAIDSNDYTLARRNFETLIPFLEQELPETGFPLNPKTLSKFLVFTEGVRDKGLSNFFPETPEKAWAKGVQFVSFADTLEKLF